MFFGFIDISVLPISLAIVAVIVAIFFVFAKREAKRCEEYVANLSKEEVNRLKKANIVMQEGGNPTWVQEAIVMEVKIGNSKSIVNALFFDCVMRPGNFSVADISINSDELTRLNIHSHDFIMICVDAKKGARIV